MTDSLKRRSFRAMGTTVELALWGASDCEADSLASEVRRQAEIWETRFSRFREESELNRVNRSSGKAVMVSRTFLQVLDSARMGYMATDGRFDPAILDALEVAGYDRSFDRMIPRELWQAGPKRRRRESTAVFADIEIDWGQATVRLPSEMRIDLGGIAKGAFVDSVMHLFGGVPGALVDTGGDLAIRGIAPDGDIWRVGVQHPGNPAADLTQLTIPGGTAFGVATSSARVRSWRTTSGRACHLIEPRTGQPIEQEAPSLTVVADTVTQAEIETKSILLSIIRGEIPRPIHAHFAIVAYESGHYESIDFSLTRS